MNKTASLQIPDDSIRANFGFLRLSQVLAIYPIGKSTWWAGVKEGRFPKPVKLGPRTTAWRVQDIRALIDKPDSSDRQTR